MSKYKTPTKAVITDAGCASRYLPITKTVPKAMLPMGNKPVMQLVVEECVSAGIRDIIIVATPEGRAIYEDYFGNPVEKILRQLTSQGKEDRYESVKEVLELANITVIEQDPKLPYGNGSPIASAQSYLNEDEAFVALYSDDLILGTGDVATLIKAYQKNPEAKAVITAQKMPEAVWNKYGMIALKDAQKRTLSHIVEKPKTPAESPSNLTSYGRYLLTPEVFKYLVPKNTGLDDELWTVDAITKLAKSGDVYVVNSRGKWLTTGDPKNYMAAYLRYVLEHEDYAEVVKATVGEYL
ncbi:MAG: NTP transferase domain-containing protein [Candidatus Nomurabacteria bacterium]|jgi:UTP--glucose-1-phosphate uridylyltransferase|nr:NTP transferase domain-containing protein [Candidatus Nomurabacteria bacterium]